ncbi:hypothetical protein ACFY3M_26470 [Streptomyces mirabilis]|uniref:hypothetical protein n=1 Tax=Streptomyces mirabilis TaxID=68239 RepID=UPI0036C5F8AE
MAQESSESAMVGYSPSPAVGSHRHWRVAALTAVAGNPHTPRTAVTETLPAQHPLELAWICHQNDAPDWLQSAAAALAPADGNEAVLRLLTDDELERHRPAPSTTAPLTRGGLGLRRPGSAGG